MSEGRHNAAGLTSEQWQQLARIASDMERGGQKGDPGSAFRIRWTFERVISVLTLLSVVIGGIWFAGGEWKGMQSNVTALRTDVNLILDRLEAVNAHSDTMQRQVDRIENALPLIMSVIERPTVTPARPAFSRADQFEAGGR